MKDFVKELPEYEAKILDRLKKYFMDRDDLDLKIAGIERQLACNDEGIGEVFGELDELKGKVNR